MRCCECEVEPLTPGHFCECCGRKLSLQERQGLETAVSAPSDDRAAQAPTPSVDRLVGVHFPTQPAPDRVPVVHAAAPRPLVDPILEAHFAGHVPSESVPTIHAVAYGAAGTTAVSVYAGPVAADAPVDVSAAHSDSDVPVARCEICAEPAEDDELCAACRRTYHSVLDSEAFALPADAAPASVPALSPALVAAAEVAAVQGETRAEQVAVVSAAVTAPVRTTHRVEVAAPPPAPPPVIAPVQSRTPKVETPLKSKAPVVAARMPLRQPSPARTIAGAVTAVVVVAAIGFPLGKLWLGHQETAAIVLDEPDQPTLMMSPAVVQVSATTSRPESAPTASRATTPVPPQTANAPRPSAARVPPKPVRPSSPSARPVAAAAIPSPVMAAPAPEAAPAPVVAPEPKSEAPAAPVGPFFELRDVNETPRVATRVEPHVPAELRDRPLNEVVIVRVLVTQAGHPLIVNLLRRSKSGPSLDDAIVAAVKQWTFVPARKRGQAVSCWYHVGVPVTSAH